MMQAIQRQVGHYGLHVGQIVLLTKQMTGKDDGAKESLGGVQSKSACGGSEPALTSPGEPRPLVLLAAQDAPNRIVVPCMLGYSISGFGEVGDELLLAFDRLVMLDIDAAEAT